MRQTIQLGTPAVGLPLALLSDLKADLGISDDLQDARLQTLLLDASDMVVAYIGRPVLSATWRDVIVLGADDQRGALTLGRYPLSAIMAFSINGNAWSSDDIAGLPFNPDAGMIYPPDGGAVSWHAGHYVITYQAGWRPSSTDNDGAAIAGTVPRMVQQATRLTAAGLWHASGRDPALRSESEQGVGSTSWVTTTPGAGGLPQAAADALRNLGGVGVR